ncbi:MAG: toprim domain-containing protein [bacterium]
MLDLIGEPLRAVSSSEQAGPCPLCRARTGDGGRDRLHVDPMAGWWFCRQCHPRRGDAPGFLMARDGLRFPAALRALGLEAGRPASVLPSPPPAGPSPEWTARAGALAERCAALLWTPEGEKARTWLHRRGLEEETLKRWGLGFCPGGTLEGFEKLPRAISIPWREGSSVRNIRFRLPSTPATEAAGKPKYLSVKGGRPGVFGVDLLQRRENVVITEGEFDCMALHQAAGSLVDVLTCGSCSASLAPALPYLFTYKRVLLCFDKDGPGNVGAEKALKLTRRARRVRVPGGHKDITDFLLAEGEEALRWWTASLLDPEFLKIRTPEEFEAAIAEGDPQNRPKFARQKAERGSVIPPTLPRKS